LEDLPHLCPIFVLDRTRRSLPETAHGLASGCGTGDETD